MYVLVPNANHWFVRDETLTDKYYLNLVEIFLLVEVSRLVHSTCIQQAIFALNLIAPYLPISFNLVVVEPVQMLQ